MSYVRVPPDGAGKRIHTESHLIEGEQVETQVVHLGDGMDPTKKLRVDTRGSASVRFDEGQPILGGFGALKTTEEHPVGIYESSLDTYAELFSHITANGGELVYDVQASSEVLRVNGLQGSSVLSLSNRYHYYMPGSSNVYKMTVACGDFGKTGNCRKWGAFDSKDGVFFELHDTTLKVVIRSSISGTVVETAVNQADWNVDKLDGTGLSGFTIDITKVNVYWLDYQWLGAGRVRFGIYDDSGARITCHVFENAGSRALPYMRTGTLPAGLSNENTTATGSTSELRVVCIGVYTEADFRDYTYWRYADIDSTKVVSTADTHMFSVRATPLVNNKHNSVVAYPETLNVYCDQPVEITLWQDTSVSATSWAALASTLDVSYAGSIDSLGSTKFKTIFCAAGVTVIDLTNYYEVNDEGIQMNADGTAEIWTVTSSPLTTTANVKINLGYKELW